MKFYRKNPWVDIKGQRRDWVIAKGKGLMKPNLTWIFIWKCSVLTEKISKIMSRRLDNRDKYDFNKVSNQMVFTIFIAFYRPVYRSN